MKRILICEDSAVNAELFVAALRRGPYEIHAIKSANSIVDDVVAFTPDLVLMDLRIPGVGGEEAVRLLRADERTTETPILLHSANVDIAAIAERLGVGYVDKPFGLVEFRARVAEAAGVKRSASAR